jgi:hypothetical protein
MSWQDYVGVIPSTAAVLNGFIAVIVAQFFKDHPIAKVILVVAAGLLGVVAIGATIYGQREITAQRDADLKRKQDIRRTLGSYLGECSNLRAQALDTKKQIPLNEAIKLDKELTRYLKDNLDQSYVYRLGDSAGLDICSIHSGDNNRDTVWSNLNVMCTRLEQFSQQFGN